jgi:hypothetical protein
VKPDRRMVKTVHMDEGALEIQFSHGADDNAELGYPQPNVGGRICEFLFEKDGLLYCRFRNSNDDPFIIVLGGDEDFCRIYASEDLPPSADSSLVFSGESARWPEEQS